MRLTAIAAVSGSIAGYDQGCNRALVYFPILSMSTAPPGSAQQLEAPSRAGGRAPGAPSLEPGAWPASAGPGVVPCGGPPQAPTGPTQRPGSHTASSLRARAQHSPSGQAQQAGS
ncbi:hypothetical protein HaLaN_05114 [Haematococcus lacustris]|uniref:Uncharacterized protein n=1 Tax=Haematococcus lacustris TaxID=44745 RepID=A0A699YU08_HAELA|nr:hypothetical protein HaLaN_05114 [Haematococcus lacustris]